jgi:anti-sigma factor RsiW
MTMHYNADTLDDYLRGELEPGLDAVVHAHLEACAACRAEYDEAAGVRDWIRAQARVEEREFPAMIRARVWDEIRNSPPSLVERVRAAWRPWHVLPIAGALAAVAVFGLPALHQPSAPLVAATYYLQTHAAQAAENPLSDRSTIVTASLAAADRQSTLPLIDAVERGEAEGSGPP